LIQADLDRVLELFPRLQERYHFEVFGDRHSGKHMPTLWHVANSQSDELMGRNAIDSLAEEVDAAA
jgi:hypothetical protein